MRKIEFDLSAFKEIEVIPLSDVHIGNILCNEAKFKQTVDYILEEPADPECGRICLLNGDLTESVTRSSKGNIFNMTYDPATQMALMVKYLLPLTQTSKKYPQGKILSYCAGNHDFGRYSDTGISVAETIAVRLGLEDRFSTDGCYSFINLKRRGKDLTTVTLYNQHMNGGSTTIGGKASRIARISNGIIADIIVGSHVHSPITFKEDVIIPYGQQRRLSNKTITYVVVNAFLRYGDYAERGGYKPSTIAVPKIFIRQSRTQANGMDMSCVYTEVLL